MYNLFVVLFLSLWTSHAAVDLHYMQNLRCYQHSFANDACFGLETEQQMLANQGFSSGSCADQGYAFVCPDSTPETSESGCGWLSGNVRTNKTITEYCRTNPDCERDWCGDVGMVKGFGHYAIYECSLPDSQISQEECELKEPLEANEPWLWKQQNDGSYRCETSGLFGKHECQHDLEENFGNTFYRYSKVSCQRYYEKMVTAVAVHGDTCDGTYGLTLGHIFQSRECCGHDPNTTAAPTSAPVPIFAEHVNDETQETECFEISISPSCTVGVSALADFAPGSCQSRDATYRDVSQMVLPPEGFEVDLQGCQDMRQPMTVSAVLFFKEHPKPASGWYAANMFFDSAGCTGNPQFTSYITSDYFRFGVCKHVGDHDGMNIYKKVECTEDTIITQVYSDANCTVLAPNDEDFKTDINSDGQCKKMGKVPGKYSKMVFSGACPAAVAAEPVSDSVTDFADGTVYTDAACQGGNEFMLADAASVQDCWEKCMMVDPSVVSCYVEHTGVWDMCHCQHSCDSIKLQHEVTMWLKDTVSKPAFTTVELPLNTCTQLDELNYPDQYSRISCYDWLGYARVRTYDDEECQGSPKFEDHVSMNCSDVPFIAGDIQFRLSEMCDVTARVTQAGCGEPLPWNRPTATPDGDVMDVESNTAALATFISLLAFWATL